MRVLLLLLCGGVVLVPWLVGATGEPPAGIRDPDYRPGMRSPKPPSGPAAHPESMVPPIDLSPVPAAAPAAARARPEPRGHEVCASGCAVSHHPTERLERAHGRELLEQYQRAPADRASEPLDALVYFGPQTRALMNRAEMSGILDGAHRRFLERELDRDRMLVSIRVVDEQGAVRVYLPPTSVPQHVRQVFTMDVHGLQPLVSSGTVKRVGLDRVWQRL